MTKKQLAEQEFPPLNESWTGDDNSARREGFIRGLEIAEVFAQWIANNRNVVIDQYGYWVNPGVNVTPEELLNIFLTEKYGTHEQY